MDDQRNRRVLPDSFLSFDELPNSAFVRLPVLEKLYACSASTIWRLVSKGRIPSPQKLSHRVTVWNVGQLRNSIASDVQLTRDSTLRATQVISRQLETQFGE